MRTLIFRTIAPGLTSLMLLFSVFVLLRGHNEPGGGFIGGLIAASAFAIYGIAFGVARGAPRAALPPAGDRRRRPVPALRRPGCCRSPIGVPFLTGLWTTMHLFGVAIDLSTVMVFDIGVYLVVVGALHRDRAGARRAGTTADGSRARRPRRPVLCRRRSI